VQIDEAPLPFTAARGLVKHAYHTAAEVRGVSVAIDRRTYGGALTGTVVSSNPILLAQSPLVFVVPGKRVWRWPVESVQVTAEGQVIARLGALEGM